MELSPLSAAGIAERIWWNTGCTEWKRLDDPDYVPVESDPELYREKKIKEIRENGRFRHGIHTALEIYTRAGVHIGFINCYAYPAGSDMRDSAAVGIVIPEEKYRGSGFGREALRLYAEYLSGCGVRELYLLTYAANRAMIMAGAAAGFSVMWEYAGRHDGAAVPGGCGHADSRAAERVILHRRGEGYADTEKSDDFGL